MRVTILGASFTNENLGVCALAAGVVTCVVGALPDAEISILDFAREASVYQFSLHGRSIPIRTVNIRMKPYPANNIFVLLLLALVCRVLAWKHPRTVCKNAVLQHILESDLILSMAGGDSFSDIYGLRRLVEVSLPQLLAVLLGKELIFLPQTIGPFQGKMARTLARFVMKRAGVIYSRDDASHQEAIAVIGRERDRGTLRLTYDVGFIVEPLQAKDIEVAGIAIDNRLDGPLIGLNISGLLYIGGYRRNDVFGFQEKYIEFADGIIEFLINVKGARVLLVPHCIGDNDESDSTVSAKLYERLSGVYPRKLGLVRGIYTAPEIKHVIGQCEFFVGSRMHACIGALSQCVPAVAVSYSRKFVGVLDTLELGSLVVDPQILSAAEMLTAVGECYERRGEIRGALEKKMPTVRTALVKVFSDIGGRTRRSSADVLVGRP